MSRKIFAVILVFLCFAPIALVQISSTNGEPAPALSSSGPAARSLTSHDPIYIDGNDQFTEANGVSAGNGTADNPYIIENWDINASTGTNAGIEIKNTDVYFIIRNCFVYDGWILGVVENEGVYFYNVTNGHITNCTIYKTKDNDIWLWYSNNNLITNCNLDYNPYQCIFLYNTCNTTIANVSMLYSGACGVLTLYNASYNSIIDCKISSTGGDGVQFIGYSDDRNYYNVFKRCNISNSVLDNIKLQGDNTEYNTFEDSVISFAGRYGLLALTAFNNNIITRCNFIENNLFNIYMSSSDNNLIYHNNFVALSSTYQVFDATSNVWHNETLGEGNYWSDYIGYDTNGNGIGDDPYYISGGSNKDNYPLMFPYPTKPNIKTSNLTLKSTTQGLKISANISNTDAFSDQSNLNVGFFVNASNINTQQINLPRNSSQTIFTYWQVPVGNYTIKVKADPENLVKEINELDDEVSTYIELSDVAVATEDIIAAVVQNGIQLNVTLHNPGHALIGAPTYIYIDNKLEHQELIGVPAQGSNNVSFVWNGPSGTYEVLVVVDPENIFIEADEMNNNATKTIIMLAGAPDLSITATDIYFNPSTPVEGRNTTITAIAHNVGYATSSTATITFYDNENIIYTTALPAIEQSGQYPISTTFTAYNGHTIKVEITITGIEYNLGNNYASVKITTVLPDLYIDSENITITPSKPVQGGSTSITAKIYNMGEGVGEASVRFFANINLIGEKQTGEIPPGLSAEVTVIWNNTTAGAIISVKILPAYPDAQSWNDEAETLLEETKTYNLVPKNISFSSDPPIQNQSTTVSVEIWNTGEASSPNAVISFWDGTTLIGNESIGPIPPSEHLNASITWTHAQKEHTVYARIDISPHIASRLLLTTRMPDLTVSNITFSERYPENNTTVLIYITVKNQGNATSEQAELKVYAGDTLLEVITIAPLPAGSSRTEEISWRAQNLVRIKAELTTSIDADAGNNFLALLSPETTHPVRQPGFITLEAVVPGVASVIALFAGLVVYVKRYAVVGIIGQTIRYKWLDKEKALKEEPRKSIYKFIFNNPRRSVTSMSKELGMAKSALRYHLDVLEYFGHLKAMHTGYAKIYWPTLEPLSGTLAIRERKITLTIASEPTPFEKIVSNVTERGESSEKVAEETEYILESMQERGLVETKYFGNTKYYSYTFPREAI